MTGGQRVADRSMIGEPWSPTLFPWMLATAFFQEDISVGPVTEHPARGIAPFAAKQSNWRFQPQKLENGGGVAFAPFSGQHLTFKSIRDSLRLYRWCLAIIRIEDRGDTNKATQLFNVNMGTSANHRHPGVQYWPSGAQRQGLDMIWHGANQKGTIKATLRGHGFIADGKSWNACLTHRRNGQLYASTNGRDSGFENKTQSWVWPMWDNGPESRIGDKSGLECGWAYDCIILGQGELSEKTVQKLEGWAMWRVDRQADLPDDHPYRLSHPVIDEDDFPYIYRFDPDKWSDWGTGLSRKFTAQRLGQPAVPVVDYERVFFDDFRRDSVATSNQIPDKIANWFGPGYNNALGNSAQLRSPLQRPQLFHHQPNPAEAVTSGGILTLSLRFSKDRWYAPAIYSVDDSGKGLSWEGETIFRLRCRAPVYDKVPGGLFPAFWCYAIQPIFLRHSERIEIDFWEFEGKHPFWLNGGSSHVHKAHRRGPLSLLEKDAKNYKVLGIHMDEDHTKLNQPLSFWDGQWHIWEFRVDRDFSYLNVTIEQEGQERWIELYRCPTPLEYFERKHLIINNALRAKDGVPDPALSHDIEIDFVEVLQTKRQLATPPSLFSKIPTLEGDARIQTTIHCETEMTDAIEDVWYHWHVDGYPRAVGRSPAYRIAPEDLGGTIRCLVRAVGAINQPEVWSSKLGPVT